MKKLTFIVCVVGFTVTACGSKSETGGKKSTLAREAYQFSYNGCDTKPHEFIHSSAGEARRLLCEALQDDELNQGCAEILRRDYFRDKCSGDFTVKYKPRDERPARPNPGRGPEEPSSEQELDRLNRGKLESHTELLAPTGISIVEGLSPVLHKEAEEMAARIDDCGMNNGGPRCEITSGLVEGLLIKVDEKRTYVSFVTREGQDLALVFPVESIDPVVVKTVLIFKVLKRYDYRSLSQYLKVPGNLQPLLKVDLAPHFESAIVAKMNSPKSIKQLYYAISDLMQLMPREGRVDRFQELIARALEKNIGLILRSSDPSV